MVSVSPSEQWDVSMAELGAPTTHHTDEETRELAPLPSPDCEKSGAPPDPCFRDFPKDRDSSNRPFADGRPSTNSI